MRNAIGNAIGNSIVGASKPKTSAASMAGAKKQNGSTFSWDESESVGANNFYGADVSGFGKELDFNPDLDFTPSAINGDDWRQTLANVDQAEREANATIAPLSGADGKPLQFAALNMSEFVAQAQSLSDKLHVQPGFMRNSYDNAMSEASNPNNSWLDKTINLAGATAMFPLMAGEELTRGLLNIPSGVAGAVPAADRLGQDIGAMLDTSLTTSDRFIAGGNALINFSAGFTGLGAPAAFFTGSLATAPLAAEQRGLQGLTGGTNVASGAARNPNAYEVIFEAPISGASRSAHRASANKSLANQLRVDGDFAGMMNRELNTNVLGHMQSGRGLLNPPGTVWHHPVNSPSVMQLLRRSEHTSPSLQNLLHPSGIGGYGTFYGP